MEEKRNGTKMRDGAKDDEMEQGNNGKYDNIYKTLKSTTKGKPTDMGKSKDMVQHEICATGDQCRHSKMPLSTNHRCMICAFCVHTECATELRETTRHKIPSTNINLACNACITEAGLQRLVKNKELSLGNYAVHKYLRPKYPNIILSKKRNDDMETEESSNPPTDSEDDATSGEATIEKKNKTTTKTSPKQKKKRATTPPTYMDVHLVVPPTNNSSSPIQAIETLTKRLEEWLQGVQSVEKSFKLHTVDPESQVQTIIHHPSDFPSSLPDIKQFFKGARPIPKGGKIYTTIKASFEGTTKELMGSTEWYHSINKERFAVAALQACHKEIVGWLLYSLRTMDAETLTKTLEQITKAPIALRWMRISDGSYAKGRDYTKDPRALHIECARENASTVKSALQKTYSSKATEFPLKVRLRYVPQIQQLMDLQSRRKFHQLSNRQMGWTTQYQMLSRDDIIEIDSPVTDDGTTIREMIMGIKNAEGEPIFSSIDRKWNGQGYNFSYHPKFSDEGPVTIRGLYPRLHHNYGDGINRFFAPSAVKEGKNMTYDPITQAVSSMADETINDLMDADPDMEFAPIEEIEADKMVFEKIRNDEDSVSTFNKSKRSHPSEIDMQNTKKIRTNNDKDESSSTSSISINTKRTMDTRLTRIEANIHGMESRIETKITDTITNLLKSLNPHIQNNPVPNNSSNNNQNTTQITPNKTNQNQKTTESLELSNIDV